MPLNEPVAIGSAVLYLADCVEAMAALPPASVDAIATDPPYGMGFMGREWDTFAPDHVARIKVRDERKTTTRPRGPKTKLGDTQGVGVPIRYDEGNEGNERYERWCELWASEALRVLRPGGHLLASGGARTHHRLMCGIEDAGFEIRDTLSFLYGSGFPKSLNVGDGRGTALKPAWEPIVLARKPLVGTVAVNLEAHGTGALNIDASRIEGADGDGHWSGDDGSDATSRPGYEGGFTRGGARAEGRWPANVLLDEEAAALLDAQAGDRGAFAPVLGTEPRSEGFSGPVYGDGEGPRAGPFYSDTGGPSRFFYTSKASRSEREAGLEGLPTRRRADSDTRDETAPGSNNPRLRVNERRNDHPTVKPLDLMRWLVRLVTPPGGVVLDPFMGSGTTGVAALELGYRFIGIEREDRYFEIARRRIARERPLHMALT